MSVFAILGISLNPLSDLRSIIDGLFSAMLKLFAGSASDVVTALLGFMTTTTDPLFSSGWWSTSGEAVFVRVVVVSGALMALAFLLSIITAVLAGDPKVLMKAVLHLPLAVVQTTLLVAITATLLSATDEVSSYIASGASQGLKTFVAVGMVAAIVNASVVGLMIGAFVILAAISVWLQLIVRTALLYVAVLGAPLIFAASVHPSVRGIQKRYIEFGIGLICSKIVVAIAFATGAAALSSLGSSPSFSAEVGALLEALAILLVACFAPYLFVRLLIGAEALVVAEGLERRPFRAAMQAQQTSSRLAAGSGGAGLTAGMAAAKSAGTENPFRPDAGPAAGPTAQGTGGAGGGKGGGVPGGGPPSSGSAAGHQHSSEANGTSSSGPPSGQPSSTPSSLGTAALAGAASGLAEAREALRNVTPSSHSRDEGLSSTEQPGTANARVSTPSHSDGAHDPGGSGEAHSVTPGAVSSQHAAPSGAHLDTPTPAKEPTRSPSTGGGIAEGDEALPLPQRGSLPVSQSAARSSAQSTPGELSSSTSRSISKPSETTSSRTTNPGTTNPGTRDVAPTRHQLEEHIPEEGRP